eukprot:4860366-Amphidinium_carterae.1
MTRDVLLVRLCASLTILLWPEDIQEVGWSGTHVSVDLVGDSAIGMQSNSRKLDPARTIISRSTFWTWAVWVAIVWCQVGDSPNCVREMFFNTKQQVTVSGDHNENARHTSSNGFTGALANHMHARNHASRNFILSASSFAPPIPESCESKLHFVERFIFSIPQDAEVHPLMCQAFGLQILLTLKDVV